MAAFHCIDANAPLTRRLRFLVCFGLKWWRLASGGAAQVSIVGGQRGQRHQVERDLPQRRLTGQRPQQADGVLDGEDLLQLLLRPRQRDLRRETGARERPEERPGVSIERSIEQGGEKGGAGRLTCTMTSLEAKSSVVLSSSPKHSVMLH